MIILLAMKDRDMVCRLRRQFNCNQLAVARCLYVPKTHGRYVFRPRPSLINRRRWKITTFSIATAQLKEAVRREGGGWIEAEARKLGELLGKPETINLGVLANRFTPELRTHDRFGYRIDEVAYHPAYHELMRIGIEAQTHSLPWVEKRPGAHVARVALVMIRHQIDEGTSCPLTMTFAAIPSLRLQPELATEWEPRSLSCVYDPRSMPAEEKDGVLFGMGMTERQGGSDVRANTTLAEPVHGGGSGNEYLITGHKWFCSAPMCDAFFILAQAPGGLSCFLLPRWRSDGTRNALHLLRLKDKLGNRSNVPSSRKNG